MGRVRPYIAAAGAWEGKWIPKKNGHTLVSPND